MSVNDKPTCGLNCFLPNQSWRTCTSTLPEQFMIFKVIIIIAVLMRWFSSSPLPSRKLSVSSGT